MSDKPTEIPLIEHSTTPIVSADDTNKEDEIRKADSRWNIIFKEFPEIARHFVSALLCLFSLWIFQQVIYLLGHPSFFNVIPVEWIVEVGELVLLLKFVWHIIKEFNK